MYIKCSHKQSLNFESPFFISIFLLFHKSSCLNYSIVRFKTIPEDIANRTPAGDTSLFKSEKSSVFKICSSNKKRKILSYTYIVNMLWHKNHINLTIYILCRFGKYFIERQKNKKCIQGFTKLLSESQFMDDRTRNDFGIARFHKFHLLFYVMLCILDT